MAEPPVTSQPYLDKYESDVVSGTWQATGIFTAISYGSGLLVRPVAPKTAGKIASLGSSTHLPPATEFKGAAFPRAGLLTLFNALPAPGWIFPPEVFGLKPGYLVAPGEFGPGASKLLHLAGVEPSKERADFFASVTADKVSLETIRFVPLLDTPTLVKWHQLVNTPEFLAQNPNTRASELSAIVYAQLLKRKVFDVQPADDFERGLLANATPKNPPVNPLPAATPATSPAATPATSPAGIFSTVAASIRNAPETFQPTNSHAINNVAAATGLRKQLATERFDP
jgi:hypothetical protein